MDHAVEEDASKSIQVLQDFAGNPSVSKWQQCRRKKPSIVQRPVTMDDFQNSYAIILQ